MGKNVRILFDRPKPTVGCSASGRRIIIIIIIIIIQRDNTMNIHRFSYKVPVILVTF
jgi:hypothetical protein